MKPKFEAGRNIAMKVPAHEYEQTVAFYREILGMREIVSSDVNSTDTTRFDFGGKNLWLDRVAGISQAEIWLEIMTDDLDRAAEHFEQHNCARCDEIEPLPEGLKAFWLSSPANIIHLVTASSDAP